MLLYYFPQDASTFDEYYDGSLFLFNIVLVIQIIFQTIHFISNCFL